MPPPAVLALHELHLVLAFGTGPQQRAERQVQNCGRAHCQEDRGVGRGQEESWRVAR